MEYKTYNGVTIPSFMYGTAWKKEQTAPLVKLAVSSGFRAIDTANQLIHYDEARVGEALQEIYKNNGITRGDLFLQTKFTSVGGQDHRTPYDRSADHTTQVKQSMDSSLKHLHTDAVDSYVLHGPSTRVGLNESDWEVWAAIESLYEEGKTKIIGVSNVDADQLALLCGKAKVKPMVVQNRCFAVDGWDRSVREICKSEGIIYQGFSLLTANAREMANLAIRTIATNLDATIAQVIFKFSMKVGMLPLTGTSSERHMKEDLDAVNLELSDEEVEQIERISG